MTPAQHPDLGEEMLPEMEILLSEHPPHLIALRLGVHPCPAFPSSAHSPSPKTAVFIVY